jgi:hypothetical protein
MIVYGALLPAASKCRHGECTTAVRILTASSSIPTFPATALGGDAA